MTTKVLFFYKTQQIQKQVAGASFNRFVR